MAREPEETTASSTEGEARSNYAYRALEACRLMRDKTMLVKSQRSLIAKKDFNFLFCATCFLQVIGEESVTGLELHRRVSAAVYLLKSSGVVSGARVLIMMTPCIDFLALLIGTFYIGVSHKTL